MLLGASGLIMNSTGFGPVVRGFRHVQKETHQLLRTPRWDGAAYEPYIWPGLVLMAAPRRYGGPTAASGGAALGLSIAGPSVGQVRGVLAERVIISTLLDPFLSLRALAAYSGISVRKLHDHLNDPFHPLPHYRVGGKILVRRSQFDGWMARFRQQGHARAAEVVEEVLRGLRS